jgi:3-deoxy-D-manno-octulosonic-acid transferase
MRSIYTLLIYIAAPIVALAKWLRGALGEGELRDRWGLARASASAKSASAAPVTLWVHAVSVGEVQAGAVLVRALFKSHPDWRLIVTTGTKTGAERVRALFGDAVQHVFLPYDMPGAVRRFLRREQPRAGVVLETEIWPNLFRACRKENIPLLMASARLSEKSVHSYRRLSGLVRDALCGVRICAQTQTDAERFIAIGADPTLVEVVGNIKFDIEIAADVIAKGRAIREAQFAERPVWIAASTHEGEEAGALDAHQQVRAHIPNALLILVPRHPQRFASVRSLLETRGVPFVARSADGVVGEDTQVLLVDTLGELVMFYAASDVAFVGGSLVPIGGHNLLEPAALAIATITGPHNFNAPDIAHLLLAQDAALQIDSFDALAEQVATLLRNAERRIEHGVRARSIVESNRGTLQRLLERIDSLR